MERDLWLPIGYELGFGIRICTLLDNGSEWQIYQAKCSELALVAKPSLAEKWVEKGLLQEELLYPFTFGSYKFLALSCSSQYTLAPIQKLSAPESKVDAMAFAVSLRETRKIDKESPIHDAIYVEKLSRLLPTWSVLPQVSDDIVLGTWLTGGVAISTHSFRRLSMLMGWMNPEHLRDVILAAGLDVPNDTRMTFQQSNKVVHDHSDLAENQTTKHEKHFILPGRPMLEKFFNEHVIDIIFNSARYEAFGINFPSAIVLHGPPGCGKTFAVERLVEYIDWPSFYINSETVGSPYIHETSRKISEIFNKAIDSSPSVIIIDEMESFLSERRSAGVSGLYHVEEVAEFLRRIPEAINSKVLIIGMTNFIEIIDPAILRRGRFDHLIEVGMPSRQEVEALIESLLSKIPTTNDIDISPLLEELTEKPLSDVTFVIREAARLAAKSEKSRLDQYSLVAALSSLPGKHNKHNGHRRVGFVRD